jgi:hypothetical protein
MGNSSSNSNSFNNAAGDSNEYAVLIITTHGAIKKPRQTPAGELLWPRPVQRQFNKTSKINAVSAGVCNYLAPAQAYAMIDFIRRNNMQHNYSFEEMTYFLPELLNAQDLRINWPGLLGITETNNILDAMASIPRPPQNNVYKNKWEKEYAIDVKRNGKYNSHRIDLYEQYNDKEFLIQEWEKRPDHEFYDDFVLLQKGKEPIYLYKYLLDHPELLRPFNHQLGMQYKISYSSLLRFINHYEPSIQNLITIDLSCMVGLSQRDARAMTRTHPAYGGKEKKKNRKTKRRKTKRRKTKRRKAKRRKARK